MQKLFLLLSSWGAVSLAAPLASHPASAVISVKNEYSNVQAAIGQIQKYCGINSSGRQAGCPSESTYKNSTQSQGLFEAFKSQSLSTLNATDYERSRFAYPMAQGSSIINKEIIVAESTVLRDMQTGFILRYDFGSSSGNDFRAAVATLIAAVPSATLDFEAREQQYNQVQTAYQNFYNQATQQNAQIANQIRAQATQIQNVSESQKSLIFPNMAIGLSNLPRNNLSQAQLISLKNAQLMAVSSLSHKTIEMNQAARQEIENKFRKAVAQKDYSAALSHVEALTRGLVDGKRLQKFDSAGMINKEGVVNLKQLTQGHLTGPFDSRSWATSAASSEGEVVRRLANRYQQIFLESAGLSVLKDDEKARFTLGQIALNLGDQNLHQGLYERGSSFLALADRLIESVAGTTIGVGEGIIDLVKSIPEVAGLLKDGTVHLLTEPAKSWGAVIRFATSLPELAGFAKLALIEKLEQLKNASDYDRGRALGHTLFDVATIFGGFGEVEAVKALGSVEKLESLAAGLSEASKGLRIIEQSSEAIDHIGEAVVPIEKAISEMPQASREGLISAARNSPEMAAELARAQAEALAKGQSATASYLEKMMASGEKISAVEVDLVASTHAQLLTDLPQAPSLEFSGDISRGIRKVKVSDGAGGLRDLTSDDVLKLSPTNSMTEHRFSIGGPLGEKAQYFVVGDQSQAFRGISKELKISDASEILIRQTNVSGLKVLDTTNPEVRAYLKKSGVYKEALEQVDNYNITQALGSAARQSGFQGLIVAPSNGRYKNLVIFK